MSAAEATPARLDALVEGWTKRGNRVASSAWLYHLGLDAFCLGEHANPHRRTAPVFAGLIARDLLISSRILQSDDAPRTASNAAIVTIASDVGAAMLLRRWLPRKAFVTDRSLSQFGLAVGWAFQFALPRGRAGQVVGHAAPIATQIVFSSLWRLKRGEALRYVAVEALWSTTALLCVERLSASLREAVSDGRKATESVAALSEAEAVHKARDWTIEQTSHAFINSSLREYRKWVEVIEGDTSSDIIRLVEAEAERLRSYPEPDTYTISSLLLFVICIRDGSIEPAEWTHSGPDANTLFTRRADSAKIRNMIAMVTEVVGPIRIRTHSDAHQTIITINGAFERDLAEPGASFFQLDDERRQLTLRIATQAGRFG